MYEKELMMGVLIASSTLMGLTGIFVTLSSQRGRKGRLGPGSIYTMGMSILLGLSAVMGSVGWFISPIFLFSALAFFSFVAQLIIFVVLAGIVVWRNI